jgi:hypothetical protein
MNKWWILDLDLHAERVSLDSRGSIQIWAVVVRVMNVL